MQHQATTTAAWQVEWAKPVPQVLGLVGLPAGYEAEVASWEFQVMPGGPPVVLNGTVEEVHAELLRLNPNWDSDFPQRVARSQDQDWTLEKRTDFSMANTLCDATWGSAHDGPISEGIERLERIGGVPRLGPGPGKCSRVSCSWDSAIWWCNDVGPPLSLCMHVGAAH